MNVNETEYEYRTANDVVETFGSRIADAMSDFDPTDMAFDEDITIAEAEAQLHLLKAAVRNGRNRDRVTQCAAELSAAVCKLAFYRGDL